MKDDPPSRAGPSRPHSGILGCIVNARPYKPEDTATLARLFTETVHSVNAADYSREQLAAWAPDPPTWNTGAGVSASGLLLLPNMIPKLLVLLHSSRMDI